MENLEYYYSALFKKAEQYEKLRRITLVIVLVLLSTALYASGMQLYALAASALFIHFFSLFLDIESKKFRNLANDFQKYSMLIGVFNDNIDVQEISSLKIRAGNDVSRVVSDKIKSDIEEQGSLYSTDEKEPSKRLLEMIQENSYWNNNLYRLSYKSHLTKTIFVLCLVLISAFSIIPSIQLDKDFTVLRLLFTVMSFSIVYEFIETMIKYKDSSREMEEIDQKISRLDPIRSQELLNIFSKYHLVKSNTPPIPNRVYEKNMKMLNQAWDTRDSKS